MRLRPAVGARTARGQPHSAPPASHAMLPPEPGGGECGARAACWSVAAAGPGEPSVGRADRVREGPRARVTARLPPGATGVTPRT